MSFFVQAHQDDWQVHMGANAYDDLSSGGKVVLIFTTAGDAGRDQDWWMTREDGARASVEVGVNAGPGGAGASWTSAMASYNGHSIPKFIFGNAVCFFMRLPDGDGNGAGFPKYGNQSLLQLHTSNTPMKAVDRNDTYSSWDDLVRTFVGMFISESQGMPTKVWHNAVGPGPFSGHSDHENTAFAVWDAAALAKGSLAASGQVESIALFKGSGRPVPSFPTIPDSGEPKRVALFNGYEDTMRAKYGDAGTTTAEWPAGIKSWLDNQDPPQLIDF